MAGTGRIGWIDWVRALGSCAVVLLHVFVATALACDVGESRWLVYNVVDIALNRWAVPAFFIISGYLLLAPDRTFGWKQALRYVGRMVCVLVTIGFFYSILEEGNSYIQTGEPSGLALVTRAVWDVVTGNTWDHLWYIYAIIVVYLCAPLLRELWSRVGEKGFLVVGLALFVGVLVVPTLLDVTVPDAAIGVVTFCMGGCLHIVRRRWVFIPAGLLALAYMIFSFARDPYEGQVVWLHGSCFAVAYALGVVELLRRVVGDEPVQAGGVIDRLAQDSFGIYVIHVLYIHLCLLFVDPLSLPPVVYEAGLFAVSLAASIATTHLLRRIPFFANVL